MKRLNKEFSLNINSNISLLYGTTDRMNPLVIYLIGKGWVLPQYECDYNVIFDEIISSFRKDIKTSIEENNIFTSKYICNVEINTKKMEVGKKTYFTFDVYFKQKEKPLIGLKEIEPHLKKVFIHALRNFENNFLENSFIITKGKH